MQILKKEKTFHRDPKECEFSKERKEKASM